MEKESNIILRITARNERNEIKDISEFHLGYTKSRKYDWISQTCFDAAIDASILGYKVEIEKV